MFKVSPIFAIIASLIFLLKPEDNNADKLKKNEEETLEDDYDDDDDDFDYDNYDDIDLDEIDYEDLLELERQLSAMSDFKNIKKQVEAKMEKKPNVIKKPNLNDELTEDDLKKGFKIKNMKKLGEFDEPDDLLDDESFPDELKDQIRASKTKTEL